MLLLKVGIKYFSEFQRFSQFWQINWAVLMYFWYRFQYIVFLANLLSDEKSGVQYANKWLPFEIAFQNFQGYQNSEKSIGSNNVFLYGFQYINFHANLSFEPIFGVKNGKIVFQDYQGFQSSETITWNPFLL